MQTLYNPYYKHKENKICSKDFSKLPLQVMIRFEIYSIIIWVGMRSRASWQDRPFSSNFSWAELEISSEMSMIEKHVPNQNGASRWEDERKH